MIDIDQKTIDNRLLQVHEALLQMQSPIYDDRAVGARQLLELANEASDRQVWLQQYKHEWHFHTTGEGLLVATLLLTKDEAPRSVLQELDRLQAIGWVIYSSLGIQQFEILGCNGLGVEVQMGRSHEEGAVRWKWTHNAVRRCV